MSAEWHALSHPFDWFFRRCNNRWAGWVPSVSPHLPGLLTGDTWYADNRGDVRAIPTDADNDNTFRLLCLSRRFKLDHWNWGTRSCCLCTRYRLLADQVNAVAKHTTLHLTPPTLLDILAFSLTNILPSLTKLNLSPKPVTITFVNFAVSGLTSIRQLSVPLLPLSSTPNLITVILCTINSLGLNYPVSSKSRTLLLVLSLKLLSPVISLPSYTLSLLAYSRWTHRIQAPLTYLQRFHNYPTSIPS